MALIDNIQAYWKLEGNSTDATGNGHNGTDTGMSYNASYGKIGQGANFVNTYPNNNSSFTATVGDYGTFTINLWVKSSYAGGNDSGFVTVGNWSTTGHFQFKYNVTAGYITVEGYGDNPATELHATTSLFNGTYNMVTVTYKTSATPTIEVFVNGSSVASQTYTSLPTINFSSATTYVGTWLIGTNYRGMVSGYMDEIGIWNVVLGSSDITALYNAGAGLQYPFTITAPAHNLSLLGVGA